LIVRERNHFWSSRPGKWLIITSLVTITVFILVGVYGVIVPPLNTQVILISLLFLFFLTILIDFPKTWFFRRFNL
jgi:H+-transporting ATPase